MAKKRKNSIQKLIGFETFTKYGVKTDKCEFVFFHVEPTNISVLSADNIDAKVHHLMMLLSMIPELEIIALDICECFDTNKSYVRKRLKDEPNEAVRDMLSAVCSSGSLLRLSSDRSSITSFILSCAFTLSLTSLAVDII